MTLEYNKFQELYKLLSKLLEDSKGSSTLLQDMDKEVKIGIPICMSLIMNGREDLIKFCVVNGANPDMQISNGFAALHVAALLNRVSAANYLLEVGANINLTIKKGLTPVDLALRFKNLNILYHLLAKGAKYASELQFDGGLAQELSQQAPISNEYLDTMMVEMLADESLSEECLLGKENLLG